MILTRIETSDQGTLGRLSIGDKTVYTLELPWRENEQGISCIPQGTYQCKFTFSTRFRRNLYEVLGVRGRSAIRIHPANWAGDKSKGYKCELNGCIALGLGMAIQPQLMITQSRAAVEEFHKLLGGKEFKLEIRGII